MTMLKQFIPFSVSCLQYTRSVVAAFRKQPENFYSNIHDSDVIKSDRRNRMELSKDEIKIVNDEMECVRHAGIQMETFRPEVEWSRSNREREKENPN